MTSAEKKIILDKGSDYRLKLRVKSDDGIGNKDLTGWGWVFTIYSKDNPTTAVRTFSGTFTGTFEGDSLVNGRGTVFIKSEGPDGTSTLPTGIVGDSPFLTEFNYYYTLTISGAETNGQDNSRQMRVLRGKLAVRV